MEDLTKRVGASDLHLASRRAEEAALRRYQAVHWLDYLVGPLGIPNQPSEKEFISCLKSGIVLCNLINKVQPGSVPKVVENLSPSPSLLWDSQPLPAYQYFENVRNFLKAVEELKLPIFEASVLERDNLEEGSSTKVVDCILALKDYHEWKQMTGGVGVYKPPRSPLVVHSAGRICPRSPVMVSHQSSRRLDMSALSSHPTLSMSETGKLEDKIIKKLVEHMLDTKENVDNELVASYHAGNVDSMKIFSKILSSCLAEQLSRPSPVQSPSVPFSDLSNLRKHKCCRACLDKGSCNHWELVEQQENELSKLKLLLSSAKQEVRTLQSQLQCDLEQIGEQVLEMSSAALGYHNAVMENRNLYNMVQDLKGNIRVYCRIRPVFNPKVQNVIDFIGEDGSLVVADPNPLKDGKKMFQFNRVFGPASTQDDVFRDTQALVRSVMDGYNVCIFAYGQTGSGKTYTMCGPPGGSAKELGISYLALNDLFELSEQRKGITKYEIRVQMVEIYNEQVRDLLAEDSCTAKLEIRSCVSENGLALPDATLRPVKSTADVMSLMKLGALNRAVGSTALNIQSSRSHSILSVHVHGEDVSGSILRSSLHLVDLAGSERVDKSEVTGDGLREAQHINKSLSCLVDVITALAQKSSHIPYRNSKLTLLLQNSLGGSAKTLMFAHVNPEGDYFGETTSTLKFAQRVSTVELGAARTNKESSEVLELKAQVERLKKALNNKEHHTSMIKRPKEAAKSPYDKPKHQATDRTPPRSRRLSIENGSTTPMQISTEVDNDQRGHKTPCVVTKPTKQINENTPPHSRRLSIENGTITTKNSSVVKSKQINERTPPRPRRLSIENGSSKTVERPVNYDRKKDVQTPSTKAHSRRLSLEGPRSVIKSPEVILSQKRSMVENENSIPKQFGGEKDVNRSLVGLTNHVAPTSPINSVKFPIVKIDTARTKIPSFQIPKTPGPEATPNSELYGSVTNNRKVSSESQTPATTTQGKGSQLKKSLRTIGKLINGSEKRNHKKPLETTTPIHGNSTIDSTKSPVSTNAIALRRQSLTGIQPEKSRRTSIGGVSTTDSLASENSNAKTPPQVRASVKLTKRWL